MWWKKHKKPAEQEEEKETIKTSETKPNINTELKNKMTEVLEHNNITNYSFVDFKVKNNIPLLVNNKPTYFYWFNEETGPVNKQNTNSYPSLINQYYKNITWLDHTPLAAIYELNANFDVESSTSLLEFSKNMIANEVKDIDVKDDFVPTNIKKFALNVATFFKNNITDESHEVTFDEINVYQALYPSAPIIETHRLGYGFLEFIRTLIDELFNYSYDSKTVMLLLQTFTNSYLNELNLQQITSFSTTLNNYVKERTKWKTSFKYLVEINTVSNLITEIKTKLENAQ